MSNEGYRIFEVLAQPQPENVIWVGEGCAISVGDYGWENDVSPDLIHLTGYSRQGGTVWHANFRASEVRFVSVKPEIGTSPRNTPYITRMP